MLVYCNEIKIKMFYLFTLVLSTTAVGSVKNSFVLRKNMPDKHFWRQWFILCAGLLYSVCVGFVLGYPSVLNLATTNTSTTDIHITNEHASWIAAINGVGGIVGAFALSAIMQLFGRKAAQYAINSFICIGWLIIPFAKDIAALYAARFIQGISVGNIYINSIILSEYVHHNRRGYFITLKKAAIAVGTLFCHALSIFYTWRQIAMFAATPPFLALILIYFWPESPSYLALSGKFEECERSFKWLHGYSIQNRMQIKSLIETQKKKSQKIRRKNIATESMMKFVTMDFQMAFLISSLLTLSLELCGRYYVAAYAIQIMMDLLGSQTSALYFSLSADLIVLLALFLSTIVVRNCKRRAILFTSGTLSVVLMLLISVISYLKTIYTFSSYFLYFTALILIFQCFIVNLGLIPVSFTLVGEVFKLEHKGLGVCVSSLVFAILYAAVVKIAAVLIEKTGLHGMYGVFAVSLAICMVILYKIVPETKDKTLQEIENELSNNPCDKITGVEKEKLRNVTIFDKVKEQD